MEDHLESHNTLPVIYPLVIYHGRRSYRAPKTLIELFNKEDLELAKEMLLNPCNIIDLTKASDSELKKFINTGLLEYALKNIYDPVRMLKNIREEAILLDQEESSNLQKLLIYVSMVVEEQKVVRDFIEETFPEDKEKRMASLAETWFQQGIEQGMHLVALNMLKEKVDRNLISKVTGLSLEELSSLYNKI